MFSQLLIAVVAALDFGWQPLPGGGTEYVLRADPQTVEQFGREGIIAELPGELHDVRRVRFVIDDGAVNGTAGETKGKLPNQNDWAGLQGRQELALRGMVEKQVVAKPVLDENPTLSLSSAARPTAAESPSEQLQQRDVENAKMAERKSEQVWFLAAVGALCGSLGANVYLGWLYAELRGRARRQKRAAAMD